MQHAASCRSAGCEYLGVMYDGDAPCFAPTLPQDGIDISDVPVYWRFANGRVVCWSLEKLIRATEDTMADRDDAAIYEAVAKEMGFLYLGGAAKDPMKAFLDDPGQFAEQRWLQVPFHEPRHATKPCWWLVNPQAAGTEAPKCLE